MLATICGDTWDVLNPKFDKKLGYSDIAIFEK